MLSLKYRPLVILLVFVIIFAAFATMACEDCTPGKTCPNPVTQPMPNPVNKAEDAVHNLLQGDNPQNVLSGGNP